MKQLFNLLVLAGIVIILAALYGRFHGAPSIMGHGAAALMVGANSCFLLALIINAAKK